MHVLTVSLDTEVITTGISDNLDISQGYDIDYMTKHSKENIKMCIWQIHL